MTYEPTHSSHRDLRVARAPVRNAVALRLMAVAPVPLLVLALAACGSGAGPGATGEPSGAPAPTSVPVSTSTTTGSASTSPDTGPSAAETVFGWLRSFEDTAAGIVIAVDSAEMLTGVAAVAAAREDGVLGEDEVLPNDYYVRNPEPATTDLTVSPDAAVTLQACYPEGECVTTEVVDLDTWSVLLGTETDPGLGWDWYGAGSLPYVFTVEDGLITEIDEQYLP